MSLSSESLCLVIPEATPRHPQMLVNSLLLSSWSEFPSCHLRRKWSCQMQCPCRLKGSIPPVQGERQKLLFGRVNACPSVQPQHGSACLQSTNPSPILSSQVPSQAGRRTRSGKAGNKIIISLSIPKVAPMQVTII